MKSQHRHELETNWLAQRLAKWIDTIGPYSSTIVGGLVAAVVMLFGFSYFSGASATRESEAWNAYYQAVEGYVPDLEQLRQSAEEHAGTAMQHWADVTWADGQVWIAAQYYVQNRAAANEALNRAAGTYRNVLEDSDDERLKSRARFGQARIYELRNELDKAREEYLAVRGGFEEIAKLRAEELTEPKAIDSAGWLATAQAPRRTVPLGPGTPGRRPEFSAGGLEIPAAAEAAPDGAPASVEDLFKGFEVPDAPEDRYEEPSDVTDPPGAEEPASGEAPDPAAAEPPSTN